MKKTFRTILALSAGVMALASCTKIGDAICAFSGSNEIRFGSNGVRIGTRAFVETDDSRLQAGGFKVAAVIDADNSVMFNSAVAYNSTDAVYRVSGGSYYFPTEGTMSFYGVYPASQAIAVSDGVATLAYTQNSDTDLVAAKATGVARQSTAVLMTFDHLLSQVSIKAQGENTGVDYKLKSVKITDANGGTYSFADDSWTPGSTTAEYTVYSNATGMAVSTSGKTDVGSAMSFVPGTVSLNVVWECYNKGTAVLVSSNDQSVSVTIEKGKHSTLNLTLPSNSSELTFVTSVSGWVKDNQNIEVKPKEFVFTVNSSGKKVKFAPGNLYWNGSEFKFEEHQYDFPTAWDSNHVGHFYWSKDKTVARAQIYDDRDFSEEDDFFAVDGGAIEGWTVLSINEWEYLIDHALSKGQSTIDGKNCVILKPDGFSGTVKESYTAAEWTEAEKTGLVALPFAGRRDRGTVEHTGSEGLYHVDNMASGDYMPGMYFESDDAYSDDFRIDYGISLRLVQVQ